MLLAGFFQKVKSISPDEVREVIKKKSADEYCLLDVRQPGEYEQGHLPGAKLVPLAELQFNLDKIKPDTGALVKWMNKYSGPYTLSCKLDGVSGLYSTEGEAPKLYTRGNGIVGQDVSHMIPYLQLPKTKDIVIRGALKSPPKW